MNLFNGNKISWIITFLFLFITISEGQEEGKLKEKNNPKLNNKMQVKNNQKNVTSKKQIKIKESLVLGTGSDSNIEKKNIEKSDVNKKSNAKITKERQLKYKYKNDTKKVPLEIKGSNMLEIDPHKSITNNEKNEEFYLKYNNKESTKLLKIDVKNDNYKISKSKEFKKVEIKDTLKIHLK